jgi:uncharacterized membrane protein
MKKRWWNVIWRAVDLIIGGIFIYAGVLKIWDPVQFARDIDNYHIVPWPIAVSFAFYLPWLEVACGLALLVRRVYAGALSILIFSLAVFIGASIAAKARGIDISCGCFGHLSEKVSFGWHLALDLVVFAVTVFLWMANAARQRPAL